MIRVSPAASRREKSERAGLGHPEAGPDQKDVGEHDGSRTDEAHLDPDGGEDHVRCQLRDPPGQEVAAEAGTPDASRAEPELRRGDLTGDGIGLAGPRVEPLVDPVVHLAEVVGGDDRPSREEDEAHQEIAHPAGSDPQHADEQHEEQRGEPDVVLEPDDGHGGAPGHQDRHKGSGIEDEAVTQARRWDGEHFLVGGEVRGEVDAQEDLRELDRLKLERADVHPQAGTVDRAEEQRRHQEHARQQEQEVAVALQVARVAHHQEGGHVESHPQRGPPGLLPRVRGVPAGDDDVADPVQQRRQGQDDRVGVGDEPPVRHVGGQRQGQHDAEKRADVGGDLRIRPQLGDHVERDDQE